MEFRRIRVVYIMTGVFVSLSYAWPNPMIVLNSFIPSVFFLFYDARLPLGSVYFVSIALAAVAYLAIPKQRLLLKHNVALSPIVSSVEVEKSTQLHLEKYKKFAIFMKELVLDRFVIDAHPEAKEVGPCAICLSCFRYERCWGAENNGIPFSIQQWFLYKTSDK